MAVQVSYAPNVATRAIQLFASDVDPHALEFLRANHSAKTVYHDVRAREFPAARIHLYGAGPPCQPFTREGCQHGTDDARGRLIMESVDFVLAAQPLVFFLENTDALVNFKGGAFFTSIMERLKTLYSVQFRVCNATEWGIPQYRKRVYIVGRHVDVADAVSIELRPDKFPTKLHVDDVLRPLLEHEDASRRPAASHQRFAVDSAIAFESNQRVDAGFVATRHSAQWVVNGKVRVRQTLPALTHSSNPNETAWVLQRGRGLLHTEAARFQGIQFHRHVWPKPKIVLQLVGNSMAGSIVADILEQTFTAFFGAGNSPWYTGAMGELLRADAKSDMVIGFLRNHSCLCVQIPGPWLPLPFPLCFLAPRGPS